MSQIQIEKILVLDESETNVLFFEMLLQQLQRKFKVLTASTGAQGEHIVHEEGVDLVICAWEMNAMPGTVFIQRLREDRRRRYLPCLIFSKRMTERDVRLARELGFGHVLGMPFDKQLAADLIMQIVRDEEELSVGEKKLRKIEVMIAEGHLTDALKMFEPALTRKKETRTRALTNLAEIWLAAKQLAKAEKTLAEVLTSCPDHLPALRLRARCYSLQGRHEEAIAVLAAMHQGSPQNIRTMLALGAAYSDAGHLDQARAVFKQAAEFDAEHPAIKDEQGKLAFKEGEFGLAAQLLAETQSGDEIARYTNALAIAHVVAGRFDAAITAYQQAIKLLVTKARVHQLYYNWGLACKKKGDLPESFRTLCESYKAAPSFEKAYVALAKVARELKSRGEPLNQELVGQVKEARSQYKRARPPAA